MKRGKRSGSILCGAERQRPRTQSIRYNSDQISFDKPNMNRNSDTKGLRFMLFCGIIMQGGDGMTLQEAKDLLSRNSICFDICEFKNESEYWRHTMLFPYTKNAKNCKVVALIIKSNQGRMNIELQFNKTDNDFIFEELHFGGFSFEMFDWQEEMLADDLLDRIRNHKRKFHGNY